MGQDTIASNNPSDLVLIHPPPCKPTFRTITYRWLRDRATPLIACNFVMIPYSTQISLVAHLCNFHASVYNWHITLKPVRCGSYAGSGVAIVEGSQGQIKVNRGDGGGMGMLDKVWDVLILSKCDGCHSYTSILICVRHDVCLLPLRPLQPHMSRIIVCYGLEHNKGSPHNDVPLCCSQHISLLFVRPISLPRLPYILIWNWSPSHRLLHPISSFFSEDPVQLRIS